jgi:hypothetical protein
MPGQIPGEQGPNTDTQQQTQDQAAGYLRAKNIKEFHSILTTAGSLCFPNGVAIESGAVVTFKNKGLFDGNWIIQKVMVHIGEGKLVTEIEFRKCLIPPKAQMQRDFQQPNTAWDELGQLGDEPFIEQKRF